MTPGQAWNKALGYLRSAFLNFVSSANVILIITIQNLLTCYFSLDHCKIRKQRSKITKSTLSTFCTSKSILLLSILSNLCHGVNYIFSFKNLYLKVYATVTKNYQKLHFPNYLVFISINTKHNGLLMP